MLFVVTVLTETLEPIGIETDIRITNVRRVEVSLVMTDRRRITATLAKIEVTRHVCRRDITPRFRIVKLPSEVFHVLIVIVPFGQRSSLKAVALREIALRRALIDLVSAWSSAWSA